jgi:hypothetical protein
MKFQKNISGNPGGRPKGITDKRAELRKLLEPHAKALVEKVIELALGGDANAMRLCIERLIPKIKTEAIDLVLPDLDMTKAETLLVIGAEVLRSVSTGVLTPEQGKIFSDIVETQRKNIEVADLAIRVGEVENTLKQRTKKS